MEHKESEFKLSKQLIELQNITPRSKGKIMVGVTMGGEYREAIIQVLVVCKTTMFSVREAMLVLATCTKMSTKQKAIQIYRLMKEITEELENSIIIPNEKDEDIKDDLIGQQINRVMRLQDICSELNGEQLDLLIKYGQDMIHAG
jgi:hypothetical protein